MTSNTQERGTIVAVTTTSANFIVGVVGIVMPLAVEALGGGSNANPKPAPRPLYVA